MTPCFLGIDTSNYTTSIALCDGDGRLLSDSRQVLTVKAGERGLRQSEALFQHVRNLPEMLESLDFSRVQVAGIAASVSPRPVEDSYMPVFRAGSGPGRTLA
ncbi:MAG: peptidase M22, partial [Eubacterium aggregans]